MVQAPARTMSCILLTLIATGCQTAPHPAAQDGLHTAQAPGISQVIDNSLVSNDLFSNAVDFMKAGDGNVLINQAGPFRQEIRQGPNPATNLSGFLGNLFGDLGMNQQGGPGIQQGSFMGNQIGQSWQQGSFLGNQMGSGIQQSSSTGLGGASWQQQTLTNSDGTVTQVYAGTYGDGSGSETVRRTFNANQPNVPLRTVRTQIINDDSCLQTTRTSVQTPTPAGGVNETVAIRNRDICSGAALGELRGRVMPYGSSRRIVGTITKPDGTTSRFSRVLN